jgi:anti-sigma regulatory factor (Ser/Thr protein kinase)
VVTAENVTQAIASAENTFEDFDAVLVDLNLPPNPFEFIARFRKEFPHVPVALLTATDYESLFPLLNKYDIFAVIVRTAPLDFDELGRTMENLIYPSKAFGLARYLREPMELVQRNITSLEDKQAMMEEAIKFFRRFRPHDTDISQIRLAFEELINNAIYHGFRRSTGAEKYALGAFERLERGEQVVVEFGRDKNFLGCSVTDNQGTMDISTVMKKLERQITREGILDESGRGLYLTRTLSDKMVINIHPAVMSQVVLLFAHRHNIKVKPFHLNYMR